MKINVLIDTFFPGKTIDERIAAIAECGFKYIECWTCGKDDAVIFNRANAKYGTELVSVALNAIDSFAVTDKNKLKIFLDEIDRLSDYALNADCQRGIINAGQKDVNVSSDEQEKNLTEVLAKAAELVKNKGFLLNLEALNSTVNHKGCFLDDRERALRIVRNVDRENVKMLYDIYHMAIMHGNQTQFICDNIDRIGHFHAAGLPGRHELSDNEINYSFMVSQISKLPYEGFFGLEYFPKLESSESLKQLHKYFESKSLIKDIP